MSIQPEKALAGAVLVQAIKDSADPKHADDARSFVESDSFVWLWEDLLEDVQQMPDADTARQLIINGEVSVGRKAYHSAEGDNSIWK